MLGYISSYICYVRCSTFVSYAHLFAMKIICRKPFINICCRTYIFSCSRRKSAVLKTNHHVVFPELSHTDLHNPLIIESHESTHCTAHCPANSCKTLFSVLKTEYFLISKTHLTGIQNS